MEIWWSVEATIRYEKGVDKIWSSVSGVWIEAQICNVVIVASSFVGTACSTALLE